MKNSLIIMGIVLSIILFCFGIRFILCSYELSENRYQKNIDISLEENEIITIDDKQYVLNIGSYCLGYIVLGGLMSTAGIGCFLVSYHCALVNMKHK